MFRAPSFTNEKNNTPERALEFLKFESQTLQAMCKEEQVTLQAFNISSALTYLTRLRDGLVKFKKAKQDELRLKNAPIAPTQYQFNTSGILKPVSYLNVREVEVKCPIGFTGTFPDFSKMLLDNMKVVSTFQDTLGTGLLRELGRLINTPEELGKISHKMQGFAEDTKWELVNKDIGKFFNTRNESEAKFGVLYGSMSRVESCDKDTLKFFSAAGKFEKGEELLKLIETIDALVNTIVSNHKLDPVRYAVNRKLVADMASAVYNLASYMTTWSLYMAKSNAFIHALETNQAQYVRITDQSIKLIRFLPGQAIINTLNKQH